MKEFFKFVVVTFVAIFMFSNFSYAQNLYGKNFETRVFEKNSATFLGCHSDYAYELATSVLEDPASTSSSGDPFRTFSTGVDQSDHLAKYKDMYLHEIKITLKNKEAIYCIDENGKKMWLLRASLNEASEDSDTKHVGSIKNIYNIDKLDGTNATIVKIWQRGFGKIRGFSDVGEKIPSFTKEDVFDYKVHRGYNPFDESDYMKYRNSNCFFCRTFISIDENTVKIRCRTFWCNNRNLLKEHKLHDTTSDNDPNYYIEVMCDNAIVLAGYFYLEPNSK